MKYVEVGGARMSAIGLGTWQFGSREWGYGDEYAERDAVAIVHRALDVGITLFDTAEIYAFGRSERILGRALDGRRDEAFLATKIFPVLPVGPVVLQRARGSLRRLGVKSIDLYQIHQPNPVVPLTVDDAGLRPADRRGSRRTRRGLELRPGPLAGGRRRPSGGRCCPTRSPTTWWTAAPNASCCRGRRPTTG